MTLEMFDWHQDTVGIAKGDLGYCGPKTYTTGQPWLSVLVPADPLSYPELQVTTNDYTFAATYTINLVVAFQNSPAYPGTKTEVFQVILLHPCKETVISSTVIP